MITKYIRYQYGVTQVKYYTLVYTCVTLTNNIWFWQNFTPTMHRLLAMEMLNFS